MGARRAVGGERQVGGAGVEHVEVVVHHHDAFHVEVGTERGEVELRPGSRFLVGDKMLRLETP